MVRILANTLLLRRTAGKSSLQFRCRSLLAMPEKGKLLHLQVKMIVSELV